MFVNCLPFCAIVALFMCIALSFRGNKLKAIFSEVVVIISKLDGENNNRY